MGRFIALVGPNGGGKSTQARRLATELSTLGYSVVLTREPGGSPGAEDIRRLILEGDVDRWSSEVETLLFMAARLDHLEKTIRPALQKQEIVITDRYLDDTRVFQALKNERLQEIVEQLVQCFNLPEADHTFVIDVPVTTARLRMSERVSESDRFEQKGMDYEEMVRQAYLNIAQGNPHRCVLIDGDRSVEAVYEDIRAQTLAFITS